MFSDSDPVTRNGEWAFRKHVPGCEGMPHTTIVGAGHFLQEDRGPEFASAIVDFVARHP
jgi:haloalkane dehalogenase